MSNLPHILVIDDEQQILRALRTILGQQDYRITTAESGEKGLALAVAVQPDIIILDLGLPDISGLEACRRLREWSATPIIILSAHDSENEKVQALDAGADDYLTKPFGVDELLARIRVALRHHTLAAGAKNTTITSGGVIIDLVNQTVSKNGERVKLSATEYKLLAYLATHTGKVLTHKSILENIWGYVDGGQMEYLRVYIRQLRQKIEEDPHDPHLIITESGVGYRFIS